MKQKNTLKIVLIVGVLVVLAVILARWLMKNKSTDTSSDGSSEDSSGSGGIYQNTGFPLKRYSKGDEVEDIMA